MGEKITKLNSLNSATAETSSAIVLFVATYLGIPVSTTHIVTGAITGSGAQQGLNAINWKIIKNIVIVWLITIPFAGLISALIVEIRGWY